MSDTEPNQNETTLGTKPKPFVFVLMPFAKEFDDTYQLGIKAACEKAGAYAQRLDEQLFNESMLQRIYNQIAKADVIVADMTGRNPNVFYEVGYAHALGKVVILLTQKNEDIPFDLKHYRHIVYENVVSLQPQLETAVQWGVKQASGEALPKPPIAVYHEDRPLIDKPTIVFTLYHPKTQLDRSRIRFSLTYGNIDEVNTVRCRMAIWTSKLFRTAQWYDNLGPPPVDGGPTIYPILHPTQRKIFTCPVVMSLLPEEWRSDVLVLGMRTDDLKHGEQYFTEDMVLRVSTQSGSYSYPFTARIEQDKKQ